VDDDPIRKFDRWYREEAARNSLSDIVALATSTREGAPSVRIVLFKGLSAGAFVFFTNYRSRKAADLAANPQAALAFYWPVPPRQVRVEGSVEILPPPESDAYWATRPRESQLGALASDQSSPIPNRSVLDQRLRELEETFRGREIPRPAHWGGYRLLARRVEFWEGRAGRLHDRVLFERVGEGWTRTLIAP